MAHTTHDKKTHTTWLAAITAAAILCAAQPLASCAAQQTAAPAEQRTDTLNAWLEIDTAQFRANLAYIKAHTSPKTQICPVLKGDAYGNGITLLMPSIIAEGITRVAVASNQEAADVRASGYQGKIMRIRQATTGEMAAAVRLRVEELIGSPQAAHALDSIARQNGTTIHYHLALNAGGMSRNGIDIQGGDYTQALAILSHEHIRPTGIMTHYPTSKDTEILRQLATFKRQAADLTRLAHLDPDSVTLHTAASYATLFLPQTHLDMIRPGSALYHNGYPGHPKLKPIMQFKARVTTINQYPAGNTVSYKRTKTLTRPSRLANIPVGYANGYPAGASNKGHVLIKGHPCPIVGNVTMNTMMADVTDYPDIQGGEEATLYGRQGTRQITDQDIEQWSGTSLIQQALFWAAANKKTAAAH